MVSIIVRTFNRKNFLLEALESIWSQTEHNYEVLVLDGGSTDGTKEFLESNKQVRLISRSGKNYIGALNEGIKASKGEYIAFLDDDDLWKPEFLKKNLSQFEENPALSIACSGFHYFWENNRKKVFGIRKRVSSDNILSELIPANLIPINSVLMRKEVFKTIGLFDETLTSHEEWDVWLRAAASGLRFGFIAEPLALIRKHNSRVTSDQLLMFRGALSVLEKNRGQIPFEYAAKVQQNLYRLKRIYSVLKISVGRRREGAADLYQTLSKGDVLSLFFLFSILIPGGLLRSLIALYSRLLIKEASC